MMDSKVPVSYLLDNGTTFSEWIGIWNFQMILTHDYNELKTPFCQLALTSSSHTGGLENYAFQLLVDWKVY